MKYTLFAILALGLVLSGYFYRAYTEKPTTIEVPKETTRTVTKYIDRITKQPVEVIVDRTVFDPDAAVEIAKLKKPKTLASALYRLNDKPEYGAALQRQFWGPIYLGVAGFTNKDIYVSLSWEF